MGGRCIKVISLFDGYGGFFAHLNRLGVEFEGYSVEIDKYASSVSGYNFPHIKQCGDIYNFSAVGIEDVDIVVFGFPCQPFSIAGKRGGFDDKRGNLYQECKRVIEECSPRYWVGENVSSMRSDYVMRISQHFYGITPTMLDAGDTTAQSRKRNWWLSRRGVDGVYKKLEIPKVVPSGLVLGDILLDFNSMVYESVGCVLSAKQKLAKEESTFISSRRVFDKDKKCPTLRAMDYTNMQNLNVRDSIVSDSERVWVSNSVYEKQRRLLDSGGNVLKLGDYILSGASKRSRDEGVYKKDRRYEQFDKKSYALVSRGKNPIYADSISTLGSCVLDIPLFDIFTFRFWCWFLKRRRIKAWLRANDKWFEDRVSYIGVLRKLLPIECERLMNLDDNYTANGVMGDKIVGISKTQRYKMLGNGFIPDRVIDVILNDMKKGEKK